MKQNTLLAFIFIAGLGTICLMAFFLLFSGSKDEPLPPIQTTEQTPKKTAEKTTVILEPDKAKDHTQAKQENGSQVEVISPEKRPEKMLSSIQVKIISHKNKKPIPKEKTRVRLFFNEIPIDGVLKPEKTRGCYFAQDLLPGRYTIKAVSDNWEAGEAGCILKAGASESVVVMISQPKPLTFLILDAKTKKPVPMAKVDCPNFIQNSYTDQKGFYQSERSFMWDEETRISISHKDYFTMVFNPLYPEKSGARTGGKENRFTLYLTPLSGDITLKGALVDESDNPLVRWAVFLDPYPELNRNGAIQSIRVYTDSNGAFRFDRLSPGRYLLRGTIRLLISPNISAPPFLFQQSLLIEPSPEIQEKKVICPLFKIPFSGIILSVKTKKPVPGIFISMSGRNQISGFTNQKSGIQFEPIVTDQWGFFSTKELFLPQDIFRIILSNGFSLKDQKGAPISFRPIRSHIDIRIHLQDIIEKIPIQIWVADNINRSLCGQVLTHDGQPIPSTMIFAYSGTGVFEGQHKAYTDGAGFFTLQNMFPGQWNIKAKIPKGPVVRQAVVIPESLETTQMKIKLSHACGLEGQLICDEVPSRMKIILVNSDLDKMEQNVGPDLLYAFSNMPPGKVKIVLEATYPPNTRGFVVKEEWAVLKKGQVVKKNITF